MAKPYTLRRQNVAVISYIVLNMQVIFKTRIKIGPRRQGGCDCITTLTFVKKKQIRFLKCFGRSKIALRTFSIIFLKFVLKIKD